MTKTTAEKPTGNRIGNGNGNGAFWVPVVSGLLASSCCVLQLALNAFSVGCAGFGALTPYRPLFLTLTALSVAFAAKQQLFAGGGGGRTPSPRARSRFLLTLLLTAALTFSPELLERVSPSAAPGTAAAVVSTTAPALAPAVSATPVTTASASASTTTSASASDPSTRVFAINSMGCAACANKVGRTLRSLPGVAHAAVDLTTGTATVRFTDAKAAHQPMTQTLLLQSIHNAGYEAEPASEPVDCDGAPKSTV